MWRQKNLAGECLFHGSFYLSLFLIPHYLCMVRDGEDSDKASARCEGGEEVSARRWWRIPGRSVEWGGGGEGRAEFFLENFGRRIVLQFEQSCGVIAKVTLPERKCKPAHRRADIHFDTRVKVQPPPFFMDHSIDTDRAVVSSER